MTDKVYDVLIIGAGPAGCTCALGLADSGLSVAIIDKKMPGDDKVCGDALSGTVMEVLKRMPGDIFRDFIAIKSKLPSYGIRFFAPSKESLDVPFTEKINRDDPAPGYICKRTVFDDFLHEQTSKFLSVKYFPGFAVDKITSNNGLVNASGPGGNISAKIIAGADGSHSGVAKWLSGRENRLKDTCLGVRSYYTGVTGFHPDNFIELHFFKELLPGYLWIFPMTGGTANVGLGLMASKVKKEKYPLARKMDDLIMQHPVLRERFRNAVKTGKTGAHPLAMGPVNAPLSGERFLLLGDAASLVDPFTGEGIGNAMLSGEIAAKIIKSAFEKNNFSASFLSEYDKLIKKKIFPDLQVNKKLQKLSSNEWLFNFVVRKVGRNEKIRKMFTKMYTETEARGQLKNPIFYLKLLFS